MYNLKYYDILNSRIASLLGLYAEYLESTHTETFPVALLLK